VAIQRSRAVRDVVGALCVSLAVLSAGTALFAWTGSILVRRAETELSSLVLAQSEQSILRQLGAQAPGVTSNAQAQSAVQSALADPAVEQALAASPGAGAASLEHELAQLDPSLGPALSGHPISVDLGRREFARVATDLRTAAVIAASCAAGLVALALLVAGRRDRVLRRVGRWAAVVGILAILTTWVVPTIVLSTTTRGTAHSVARSLETGSAQLHPLYVVLAAVGLAAVAAARLLTARAEVTAPRASEAPPPPVAWP